MAALSCEASSCHALAAILWRTAPVSRVASRARWMSASLQGCLWPYVG
jgi:hypothetical protein